MRYKILLADDQTIITEGLSAILSERYEVVASARNGYDLVLLAQQWNPDIIIAEIVMPQLNSLDALRILRKACVRTKFLVLTTHADVNLAVEAFRAGCAGYVLKQANKSEVLKAIENALHGRTYLSTEFPVDLVSILSEAARRRDDHSFRLTKRQREVLQLVAEGKTMKEVAMALSISTRTAESYKYEIMRFLGLHKNTELVHYAIRIGLLALPQFHSAA